MRPRFIQRLSILIIMAWVSFGLLTLSDLGFNSQRHAYSSRVSYHKTHMPLSKGPNISLDISYPLQEKYITSYPEIFLEGKIEAAHGIQSIRLNGHYLLNVNSLEDQFMKNWPALKKKLSKDLMKEGPKGQDLDLAKFQQMVKSARPRLTFYYLNNIYPLKVGLNILELMVEDTLGDKVSKQLQIQRTPDTEEARINNQKIILALVPLVRKTADKSKPKTEADKPKTEVDKSKTDINSYIYHGLLEAFTRQPCFNLVEQEKLPWLLIERVVQGSESGLIQDPKSGLIQGSESDLIQTKEIVQRDIVQQIGRVTSAEGVIFIEVQKIDDGGVIEIIGRFVEVSSSATLFLHRVLANVKELSSHKDFEDMNIAICGLAMKFRDSFKLNFGERL